MAALDDARKTAQRWLDSPTDDDTRGAIRKMLANPDPRELTDNFYKNLEFGTGGLRGIMGVGSNCMNQYTVGSATQGLANYLKKSYPGKKISVAIAHDSRNNSRRFAEITASVFSGNDIEVHMFAELRPTPLLSFAIRQLRCQSGVVITASHNPKEYNGYKAYWADGAQVMPPHDKNIIAEVNSITDFRQIKFSGNPALIRPIGQQLEDAYLELVKKSMPGHGTIRNFGIPIAYSSLHGSGITMVPKTLDHLGFSNVQFVNEQENPDGNFPTVHYPNPEESSAMQKVVTLARSIGAAVAMATDPDTDRVGIAIPSPSDEFMLLNGNQALCMMMSFLMKGDSKEGRPYVVKTIVTSELIDAMARKLDITCHNTLTGFKYIAEIMGMLEGRERFIAAGEESYGYMVGDFVRDKDAVSACALFAVMAARASDEGKTLYQMLMDTYLEFGFYKEGLFTLTLKGLEGQQQIKAMMERFRRQPPANIYRSKVVRIIDYEAGQEIHPATGQARKLDFPKSDVLQFCTETGTKVSVRPSGTEPKIKFYIAMKGDLPSADDFEKVNRDLDSKIKSVYDEFTSA